MYSWIAIQRCSQVNVLAAVRKKNKHRHLYSTVIGAQVGSYQLQRIPWRAGKPHYRILCRSLSDVNIQPLSSFCSGWKMWKSHGDKHEPFAGCLRPLHHVAFMWSRAVWTMLCGGMMPSVRLIRRVLELDVHILERLVGTEFSVWNLILSPEVGVHWCPSGFVSTDFPPSILSFNCSVMSPILATHLFDCIFLHKCCERVYQVKRTPAQLHCHSSITNAFKVVHATYVIVITWHAAECDVIFCSLICLKYVEFGLQSQEPPHRPQGPVLPVTLQSILTPISAATTAYKTVTSTTVTTTTTVAKTPTTAPALAARVSGVRTRFVFCFVFPLLFCLSL